MIVMIQQLHFPLSLLETYVMRAASFSSEAAAARHPPSVAVHADFILFKFSFSFFRVEPALLLLN